MGAGVGVGAGAVAADGDGDSAMIEYPCPDCKWVREGISELKEKHDKCQTQRLLEYNAITATLAAAPRREDLERLGREIKSEYLHLEKEVNVRPTYGFIKILITILIAVLAAQFYLLNNINSKVEFLADRISHIEGVEQGKAATDGYNRK